MKIALISEHASPLAAQGSTDSGGQNVYVAKVARQLTRFGHTVDVFTRRDRPDLPAVVPLGPRVHLIHVPAGPEQFVPKEALLPHMAAFSDWMLDYCGPEWARYDLVHANFFMSGLAALALKREYSTPFVITFHALGQVRRLHQGLTDAFPPERLAIEAELVAEASRIIAECPQDREDLVKLYGAAPERVELVPCGFDPEELGPGKSPLRAEMGIADDAFVVLQLGRLVPRKGIDNVIRGIAELKRSHGIPAHLLVVGGESDTPDPALTPEIGRLATIAAEEGVAGQVTFTGRQPRERLRDFYCAADVFVTTPWYEPFGITPLEAMACGCPMVTTSIGAEETGASDGEQMLIPADASDMAAGLLRLLRDESLRHTLVARGRERAGLYSWPRCADATAAQLRALLP